MTGLRKSRGRRDAGPPHPLEPQDIRAGTSSSTLDIIIMIHFMKKCGNETSQKKHLSPTRQSVYFHHARNKVTLYLTKSLLLLTLYLINKYCIPVKHSSNVFSAYIFYEKRINTIQFTHMVYNKRHYFQCYICKSCFPTRRRIWMKIQILNFYARIPNNIRYNDV